MTNLKKYLKINIAVKYNPYIMELWHSIGTKENSALCVV